MTGGKRRKVAVVPQQQGGEGKGCLSCPLQSTIARDGSIENAKQRMKELLENLQKSVSKVLSVGVF